MTPEMSKRERILYDALTDADWLLMKLEDYNHGEEGKKITDGRKAIREALAKYTALSGEQLKEDEWRTIAIDGLPKDLEDVLGTYVDESDGAFGIEKVYYSHEDKKWWPCDASENFEIIITHWRPLPTPPIPNDNDKKQ